MSDQKTNGLVFGKFNPPHNGHLHLIREALKQTSGDVFLLVYDHPELAGIPTAERAALINAVIHDPRLKIIECYNAPPTSSDADERIRHMDYMQEQLPKDVKIDKVFCNEFFGQDAADRFQAELVKVDPDHVINHVQANEIRNNPERYREHLHPLIAQRVFNENKVVKPCDITFTGAIDTSDLDKPLEPAKTDHLKDEFKTLNGDKDPNVHLHMQDWNVGEFDKPHLPVVIGEIEDKEGFSQQRGIRILDMAIRMPEQGWAIPKELEQFRESIQKAWDHERMINPDIDQYYVYITVDQKLVLPNKTQRRAGYHSDAFETSETTTEHAKVDNTYLVYDAIPTLFQSGPFPLKGKVDPEDCDAVLKYFDAKSEGHPPVTYPPHTMVKLTPYDIHTPAVNTSGEDIKRTFIKISFSKKPYNLIGNRINDTLGPDGKPLLDYSGWEWVPRDPHARNHRNHVVNWRREDQDKFTTVDPSVVDFKQTDIQLDWAAGPVHFIQRVEESKAQPAIAGEALYTRQGDFDITYNIAHESDWKITTKSGDQYFISDKKFRERYDLESKTADDWYTPKGIPQPAITITKDVTLRSPWGSMQYLPAGSALTQDAEGNTYGIHTTNLEQSFRRCDPPTKEHPMTEAPRTLDIMAAIMEKYPDATGAEIKAALTPEFLAAAYGKLPKWSTLGKPALHDVKTVTVGAFVVCHGTETGAGAARGEPVVAIIKRTEKGPNGEDRYGVLGGYTNLGSNLTIGEQPKEGAVRELKEEAIDDQGKPIISPDPSRLARIDMDLTIDYRIPKLPVLFNPNSMELTAQELAALKLHSKKLEEDPDYRAAVREQSDGEVADLKIMPISKVLEMGRESFTHPHEFDTVAALAEQLRQQSQKRGA